MCLAAGLHSLVWYAGSTMNAAFLHRSHGRTSGEAGSWLAVFAGTAAIRDLPGRLSRRSHQCAEPATALVHVGTGYATLVMLPFQFSSYLADSLWIMVPSLHGDGSHWAPCSSGRPSPCRRGSHRCVCVPWLRRSYYYPDSSWDSVSAPSWWA